MGDGIVSLPWPYDIGDSWELEAIKVLADYGSHLHSAKQWECHFRYVELDILKIHSDDIRRALVDWFCWFQK